MTFPKQTLTVVDPGLGVSTPVADTPVISGKAFGGSGAANTLLVISSLTDVRPIIGYGPLAEDVALAIQQRGGPIFAVIHSDTSTPIAGSLTGGTPVITIAGTPRDRYALRVQIMVGGALGVGQFRYCLDGFDDTVSPPTWSRTRIIPSGGTFAIPNSGLTLTFPSGTYVLNTVSTYNAEPPEIGTVDLASVATLLQGMPSLQFFLWELAGSIATASAAATLAAAFGGQLAALTQTYRYTRGFIDIGSGDTKANVLAQADSWADSRIAPAYGMVIRTSALPFEGFGNRKCSAIAGVAVRAFASLISTDLSRFASGPDAGVLSILFDENGDQTLDAVKIGGMRTWPGEPGFYIADAPLKSPFGSDYTDVQFGRIMDVACLVTFQAQMIFVSETFRTVNGGTIDPKDAASMVAVVTQQLNNALLAPNNARGLPGHVSALSYAVDLTQNIVTTGQLKSSVAILPLGYAKQIITTLFYTLNVGG